MWDCGYEIGHGIGGVLKGKYDFGDVHLCYETMMVFWHPSDLKYVNISLFMAMYHLLPKRTLK